MRGKGLGLLFLIHDKLFFRLRRRPVGVSGRSFTRGFLLLCISVGLISPILRMFHCNQYVYKEFYGLQWTSPHHCEGPVFGESHGPGNDDEEIITRGNVSQKVYRGHALDTNGSAGSSNGRKAGAEGVYFSVGEVGGSVDLRQLPEDIKQKKRDFHFVGCFCGFGEIEVVGAIGRGILEYSLINYYCACTVQMLPTHASRDFMLGA